MIKNEYTYEIGDDLITVTIEAANDRFRITVGDTTYLVAAEVLDNGRISLDLDGRRLQAYVVRRNERRYVAAAGDTWTMAYCDPTQPSRRTRPRAGAGAGQGSLEATMPGLVLDVCVAEGDTVERGQTLVLLEAMKMELRITAPYAGQVRQVCCSPGEVVERGQLLVELKETVN